MKRNLLLLAIICVISTTTIAQYVTIPDTAFRSYLKGRYPTCFNASDQMDTTCSGILSARSINSYNFPNYYTMQSLEGIQYLKNLDSLDFPNNTALNFLPLLPNSLKWINLGPSPFMAYVTNLPANLKTLYIGGSPFTSLPSMPSGLDILGIYDCPSLAAMPLLNPSLTELTVQQCYALTNLGASLPQALQRLYCSYNYLTSLPASMPSSLYYVDCSSNSLTSLPPMPNISSLKCGYNPLSTLPLLPPYLTTLSIPYTNISSLPPLPGLYELETYGNSINCLPVLSTSLNRLIIDTAQIRCIPNTTSGLKVYHLSPGSTQVQGFPVCNVTNNVHGCQAFPIIEGKMFYDLNSNGVRDAGEYYKRYGRVNLSNGSYSLSTDSGLYRLAPAANGTFTTTAVAPPFFSASPASSSYTFSTYDTTVTQDIALQPIGSHDSVSVQITSIGWRARPGFSIGYKVSYRNAGSTNLAGTDVKVHYDNSVLTFTSATNASVTNAANVLSLHLPSMPVGEFGDFIAYFNVSIGATLGNNITTDAAMTGNSASSVDTSRTLITGSFDPNDKEATPVLTPGQVSDGTYIDYTIRFQNTGTDTAIHVVVTDTLSSMLQANTFEMLSTSHPCIATVENNMIAFEMRNIMLPDSNVNEPASHGFIRFRIKPLNTLVLGNTVPNKAAIYFDYNSPVITNTAVTQIMSQAVPLKLISFKGKRTESGGINLQWHTNNEMSTKSMAIEQSIDTKEFLKVAEVRAVGSSNNNYTHNITNPASGNLYFRLKMFDKDGKFTYSSVILIRDMNKAGLILQENPVRKQLVLTSIAASLLNTESVLVNNVGVVVKRFTIHSMTQTIEVSDLSAGVYYLKTSQGNEKVIISR